MADYKKTLNLLETPFPMRGDLARREPLDVPLQQGSHRPRRKQVRDEPDLPEQGLRPKDVYVRLDGPEQ